MTADQRHSGPLFAGLLLLGFIWAVMLGRSAPPDPLRVDAPPQAFSAGRAAQALRMLVGDGVPHPVGTDANRTVRDRVAQAFRELGYDPEVQSAFVCGRNAACATVENVIARHSGREAGPAVLLATHYDSVAAGPGASDAGVSVAAVLEIARAFRIGPPHRNPVVFLVDDGEEAGLLGAEAFASQHPLAREVGAVVNLEARGTSGASVMFETSGDNAWLVALLGRSLSRPMASSLFYPVYERLPNDTDLTVFKRHGMPGVNFAFIGDLPHYHTPLDNIEHASPASLQHQGQNALETVRALADEDLRASRSGDAVFFDVLGLGIVRWPRGLTPPLAAIAALMVVAAVLLARVRARAPLWRAMVGFVAWLAMIVAASAGGWGAWRVLSRAGAWPGDATTRPLVTVVAFWLLGLALALLVAALFGRWARRSGGWAGCWLGWALATCAAAIYVPEASYLLLVPALAAGMVGLVGVVSSGATPGVAAALIPLVVAAALWMPPAWFLFDALGPAALPAVSGALGVVSTSLLPLVAVARRGRWTVPVLALGAAGLLGGVSFVSPAFSADRPERMNLAFFQLDDDPGARWVIGPQSRTLPPSMREVATFGDSLVAPYPWSPAATAFVAETGRIAAPPPVADVIAEAVRDGERHARLRVTSPRGARTVTLWLPQERVVSVAIGGATIPQRPPSGPGQLGPRSGLRSYTCLTVPPEGVTFDVVVAGDRPVEGYLVDQTPGLPAAGAPLLRARPPEATAIHSGDVTVLGRRLAL